MKPSKDLVYILIIISLFLCGYLFLYRPLDKLNLEYGLKIQEKELKIKEYEKELLEKDSLYNILEKQRDSTLIVIDNRKENIKYIYKNYDKKIRDINNLSTDSTISYFSTWINK